MTATTTTAEEAIGAIRTGDTVMVGGVIRKRHGQLVANRLSDDFSLLNNSRDYLLNAAGMQRFDV
jgi:acyl CoA:acetate/3-ketoacid CoA transferase alpha subunit